MNRRFEDMNKRFNSVQWMIGMSFTLLVFLMSAFKFFV